MEENEANEDWRADVTEPKDTLRLAEGETVTLTFQDEGVIKTHPDYGNSIVFGVKVLDSDDTKLWYVNAQNYNLLGQIKELGDLKGKQAKVSRKGSKRSDTRYTLTKI